MGYQTQLAWSLMKKSNGSMDPRIYRGALGIAAGVALLVFVMSLFDGYVHRLDNTAYGMYPDMAISYQTQPDQNEVAVKRGFNTEMLTQLKPRIESAIGNDAWAPMIFEAKTLRVACDSHGLTRELPVQVLGAGRTQTGFVPRIERLLGEELLKDIQYPAGHWVVAESKLYRQLYGNAALPQPNAPKLLHLDRFPNNPKVSPDEDPRRFTTLRIVGVFDAAVTGQEQNLFITDLSTAQIMVGFEGRFSQIGVNLANPSHMQIAAKDLEQQMIEQVEVAQRPVIEGALYANRNHFRKLMPAAMTITLLITIFSIYSGLTGMIQTRRRTIGVLAAMGVRRRDIGRVFVLIGMLQAAPGCGLGLIAGLCGSNWFAAGLNTLLIDGTMGGFSIWIQPLSHGLLVLMIITSCALITYFNVAGMVAHVSVSRLIRAES